MSKTRDAMVGVVILSAVALTVVGTLWLQGAAWGRPDVEMSAVFQQVGQIQPGSSVKFRGVPVGRVTDLRVEPGGELVRVSLRVEAGLELPSDPVVVLSPETMFGEWQAEIHPRTRFGHVSFPDPPDLDDLPGHALPDLWQLTVTADQIADNIGVLTERIGIAFSEETAENIASLIDNVEAVTTRLSELVEQQAESFIEVTEDVRQATRGITLAADQAARTIQRVDGLLARNEVDETLEGLAEIASNLSTLSSQLHGTNQEVRDMAGSVQTTVTRFDRIIDGVERGDGSVGRLLQDPTMAAEMEDTMIELQLLLADIRENPRRYLRLSIF